MPKKALILAGDYWHPPEVAADGIGPDLTAEGVDYNLSTEYHKFGRSMLTGCQLFVLQRSGLLHPGAGDQLLESWIRPYQEDAIENYVLSGGGFLAFHNSAWGYPWRGAYRRVLGGYYIGHQPVAAFQVNVVNPDHPVTKNVSSFTVTDEQHWLWFDYDRVELLLVNQGQDGRQSAAGWAYDYGKGRVVYLANGHTTKGHRHPQFVQLKRNAIRWLLQMGEIIVDEHPLD